MDINKMIADKMNQMGQNMAIQIPTHYKSAVTCLALYAMKNTKLTNPKWQELLEEDIHKLELEFAQDMQARLSKVQSVTTAETIGSGNATEIPKDKKLIEVVT